MSDVFSLTDIVTLSQCERFKKAKFLRQNQFYYLIGLVGAGGVGKTSIVNELQSKHNWQTFPSVARKVFAKWGFKDEKEMLNQTIQDRYRFQLDLLGTYMSEMLLMLEGEGYGGSQSSLGRPIIADRTVFDHMAYILWSYPDMDFKDLTTLLSAIGEFSEVYEGVYFMAYPAAWMTAENRGEDGFRYIPPGRNYMVSATMSALLSKCKAGVDHLPYVKNECSVKAMVETILENYSEDRPAKKEA